MVTGDDPRELFAGTEKLGLTVQGPSSPDCPECGTKLIRPFGWKAELDINPPLETEALYCEKCDLYFVDSDPPITATSSWKKTPPG